MVTIQIGLGLALLLPFWVAAIGWLSGRLLGVRVGRLRAAVAATIGWLVGLVATAVVLAGEHVDAGTFFLMVCFFAVLATMPLAIVLELVTRRVGTRPRRGGRVLRHPIRRTRSALSPLGRFRELVANARRENLVHVRYRSASALDSADFARRVRRVLEDSGGMFVKFGQIASTRTDLLPATLTTELAHLQSDVRPAPADEIQAVLESELGEPADQAFASFDQEPLAAASIGQTHHATLRGGERVVVKVQRPGVDDLVRRDGAVLAFAAAQLDRRVAAAQRVGVKRLAGELIDGIEAELDYGREAAAGARLRESRADDTGLSIPAVHATLSTDPVQVREAVTGRPVSDAAAVDACGVPRRELAERLLTSMLGQILTDGLYHADPHPGNVLVDATGTLWLLDFGAVGRLDPVALEGLQGIALGFAMSDPTVLARAVRHLADDDRSTDLRALERDVGVLLGEVGEEGGLGPAVMRELLALMERHGLEPPGSMVLLSRTMLTLEGTLKVLDPGFELAPEAERIVAGDRSAVSGDPEALIQHELLRALPALRTMPDHAETLANQLRAGRLSVRTERYAGGDRAVVEQWVNRLLVLAAGGLGAITSAILLAAGSLARDHDVRTALWVLGFSGLTLAAALLMRTVAQSLHGLPVRSD
jgi:ubiquinone biosynthesis protein